MEYTELTEKQNELKGHLAAGKYRTLIDVGLNEIGGVIQKFLRLQERPSYWYNTIIVALVSLLIGFLISLLFGEFYVYRDVSGILSVLLQVWLVGIIFVTTLVLKKYNDTFFGILQHKLIDAVETTADLDDIQHWLSKLQDLKKPLLLSLAFGLLAGLYITVYYAALGVGFAGLGPTVLAIIVYFQLGIFFYYVFFLFMPFPVRVSQYNYKLNPINPSSSEIIDHLSQIMNYFVFIMAIFFATVTLWLLRARVFNLPNIILLLLAGWGPLITLFVLDQHSLARIIKRGKWKKLNEIQAKIERLEIQEDIPSEKTLEQLTKLIDYYDRIRTTPNSALNLRAGLSFLNSLLLPLLAFVLGNLEEISNLF